MNHEVYTMAHTEKIAAHMVADILGHYGDTFNIHPTREDVDLIAGVSGHGEMFFIDSRCVDCEDYVTILLCIKTRGFNTVIYHDNGGSIPAEG
jgi:hypothetical protein